MSKQEADLIKFTPKQEKEKKKERKMSNIGEKENIEWIKCAHVFSFKQVTSSGGSVMARLQPNLLKKGHIHTVTTQHMRAPRRNTLRPKQTRPFSVAFTAHY